MLPKALTVEMFHEWEKSHGVNTQQVDITGADDVRQKLKNHEIDGFVLNESPQWERDDISPAILIGGSYNYFAVSKKTPGFERRAGSGNAEDREGESFLYRRSL